MSDPHSSPDPARRRLLGAFGAAGLAGLMPSARARASRPLGVALIGLGYYSRDLLAPALQMTKHCRLAGIVTGSPAKAEEWQRRYGIADRNVYDYAGFDRIADNTDIDVVYVVLPNHLHKPFTLRAAAAGKHVWCEKPMAMDAAEARTMIDACRQHRVQLTIGYRMQHEPNTQAVMALAKKHMVFSPDSARTTAPPLSDMPWNATRLSNVSVPALMVVFVQGRIIPEHRNPVNRAMIAVYRPVIATVLRAKTLTIIVALAALTISWMACARVSAPLCNRSERV